MFVYRQTIVCLCCLCGVNKIIYKICCQQLLLFIFLGFSKVRFVVHCMFVCPFILSFGKFLMMSSYGKIYFENYIVCPTHFHTKGIQYALKYCIWVDHILYAPTVYIHLLYDSHFICEMCENGPIPTILFVTWIANVICMSAECKISNLKGPKTTGVGSLFNDYHCVFCGLWSVFSS